MWMRYYLAAGGINPDSDVALITVPPPQMVANMADLSIEHGVESFVMLDMHTNEHGYTEVQPPLLVKDDAMYGTGQLPKFREDQFAAIKNIVAYEAGEQEKLWLIPTAEVSLTNLVRESIVSEAELPLRFTALTPCRARPRAGRCWRRIPWRTAACWRAACRARCRCP